MSVYYDFYDQMKFFRENTVTWRTNYFLDDFIIIAWNSPPRIDILVKYMSERLFVYFLYDVVQIVLIFSN